MKIQESLADASKQIETQTAKINKINQNLQSLQKQFKLGQKQSETYSNALSDKSDSKTDIPRSEEHQKKIAHASINGKTQP